MYFLMNHPVCQCTHTSNDIGYKIKTEKKSDTERERASNGNAFQNDGEKNKFKKKNYRKGY